MKNIYRILAESEALYKQLDKASDVDAPHIQKRIDLLEAEAEALGGEMDTDAWLDKALRDLTERYIRLTDIFREAANTISLSRDVRALKKASDELDEVDREVADLKTAWLRERGKPLEFLVHVTKTVMERG